ncbi:hypothetical protein [Aeromonas veronii]|uniref:hypothetical protein n=1 Tax=Aeromonas veronii TaxID=654 RepID=UPI002B46B7FD|nr:hypothetical protein [Aeromonas veronii]
MHINLFAFFYYSDIFGSSQFLCDISIMTYEEFQRRLGKAGLTARDFAALVKMHPNSISNCSRKGEVPSHLAIIVSLMGEMAEHGLDFKSVLGKIDFDCKKPRGFSAAMSHDQTVTPSS